MVGAPAQQAARPDPGAEHSSRSLSRSIAILALPVLGEQFCNILVGLVDTFLAGRISKEALAAVGLASYVGWLASMLSGFVGVGATALVARASGSRDLAAANRWTNQSMGLAGFWGVVMVCGLFALARPLTSLMSLTPEGCTVASRFLRIDAFGQFLFAYMLIGAACLRGSGDTRSPMAIMIAVNAVNVVISTALSVGIGPVPRLGVTGIAVGTLIARSLGGLLMLRVLFKGRSGLKIRLREMLPRRQPARRILGIGGPAGLDSALMWTGNFVFLTFITQVVPDAQDGTAAYAAHMVGVRIQSFSYLPAMAWGIAAATLVGQALGAGDPQRARRTGHLAVLQLLPFSIVISIVLYFAAGAIYALWSADTAVHVEGIPALRVGAFAQPSLIAMIVYVSALRGAGDTRFPLLFTVVGVFGVRLPLAYVLGVIAKGGLTGAWIGMCIDLIVRSLLAAGRFGLGRWTERQI